MQLMNICIIHSDLKFVTESINSSEESLLRAQSQGAKARLLIDFLHIIKSNTYLKKKTRTQETVFLGITNEIFFFFFLLLFYNPTSGGLTVKSVCKLNQSDLSQAETL